MKYLIAVDPGATGAIAFRDDNGRIAVDSMPETLRDIWDYFDSWYKGTFPKAFENASGVLEDAGYHVQGNNASASAKFARHCGSLEMALTASGLPWESVRPQKWMKIFGGLPKDRMERKRRIKELVQRLYPHIKVTLQNADALGILTWAIKQENGQ